ncbi:MAG: hypothetical protein RLZ22_293 [Verrucomicrobiota bacterium]|jgi:hypothetical protein
MNPIDTWIDTDEVRRLAERLMSPERKAQSTVRETGFNDSFIGFADIDPSPSAPASPAEPIAKISTPAPAPALTPAPLRQSTELKSPAISSDFTALATGLRQDSNASAVFVMNADGGILHDEGCAHLHFAARGMALNWKHGNTPNPVRLLVHAGSYLELIPVNQPQGRLIWGLVVPQPLSLANLIAIRDKASKA